MKYRFILIDGAYLLNRKLGTANNHQDSGRSQISEFVKGFFEHLKKSMLTIRRKGLNRMVSVKPLKPPGQG
jgi:hypothetical protein